MNSASSPEERVRTGVPAASPVARVPAARIAADSLRDRIERWGPVVIWISVIFVFSSDEFSANHTGNWLAIVIRAVFGELSPVWFATVHATVRKGAHLVEYAVLGWLTHRALIARGEGGAVRRWVVILVLATACAAMDELHQFLFTAYRTGKAFDVAIDVTGATLGALIARRRFTTRRTIA